jgi:hypothetical protein
MSLQKLNRSCVVPGCIHIACAFVIGGSVQWLVVPNQSCCIVVFVLFLCTEHPNFRFAHYVCSSHRMLDMFDLECSALRRSTKDSIGTADEPEPRILPWVGVSTAGFLVILMSLCSDCHRRGALVGPPKDQSSVTYCSGGSIKFCICRPDSILAACCV